MSVPIRVQTSISILIILACHFFNTVLIVGVQAHESLRQVHVITRHGSRRPLSKTANTLEEDTAEKSLLTPLGQQQQYQLGEWLRERYLTKNFGEVLNIYNPVQSHFESSSYERTLTSANSLALGLFPLETRNAHQLIPAMPANIPVYSHDRRNDIVVRAYDKCPAFHDSLEQLYDTLTWHEIELDSMPLLTKLGAMSAFQRYAKSKESDNNNDKTLYVPLQDLWNVYDTIHVAKIECPTAEQADTDICQDIDLAVANSLTDDEWGDIQTMTHAMELLKYGWDMADNRVGGVLWNMILQRMQQQIFAHPTVVADDDDATSLSSHSHTTTAAPRFYVTSAHYPTILGLFAALGIPYNSKEDAVIPEYASALILELYQDDDTAEQYVKIAYKSGVQTDAVDIIVSSRCRTNMDGGCTMEEFTKVLEQASVTPEEWCGVCRNTNVDVCLRQQLKVQQQSCSESEAGFVVGMFVAGLIAAGFFVLIHRCLWSRRRHTRSDASCSCGGISRVNHTPAERLAVNVKPPTVEDIEGEKSSSPESNTNFDGETKVDMAIYT